MKVLVVSPIPILPALGGAAARILALTRSLRAIGHEVFFAYLAQSDGLPTEWDLHVSEFGADRAFVLQPQGRLAYVHRRVGEVARKVRRRALKAVRSAQHHYNSLDERLWPGFAAPLRELQEAHQFECVMVEYVFISKLLDFLPVNTIKIIDTHDVFADRHLRMVSKGDTYRFYSIPASEEQRGLQRADVVLAIQEIEAAELRDRLGPKPQVFSVSHFIETADSHPLMTNNAAGLFLGSMSMGNADAVRYLISDILPRIISRIPQFTLYVAGSICDLGLVGKNVVPLGKVDDLNALFRQTPLLLNPTRIGTGVAIKLLEALGHGVPAVTTEIGARGHDGEMKGLVVVSDGDPSAFADAVVGLVQSPDRLSALSREAFLSAQTWNARQSASLEAAVPLRKSVTSFVR